MVLSMPGCSLTPVNSRPDQGCRQCVMSQFCDIKYINRIQHKRHTFNVKIMSSPGHSGIFKKRGTLSVCLLNLFCLLSGYKHGSIMR